MGHARFTERFYFSILLTITKKTVDIPPSFYFVFSYLFLLQSSAVISEMDTPFTAKSNII